MTKFDEFLVNDSLVRFYHGIDLEFVKNSSHDITCQI